MKNERQTKKNTKKNNKPIINKQERKTNQKKKIYYIVVRTSFLKMINSFYIVLKLLILSFLFTQYPDLEKAYNLSDGLRNIYNQKIIKSVATLKLAHWFKDVENAGFKSFTTIVRTITQHYNDILNYFINRSTNASAESFNAKIKNFRLQLRGVKDRKFFLFRLTQIFA